MYFIALETYEKGGFCEQLSFAQQSNTNSFGSFRTSLLSFPAVFLSDAGSNT